MKKKIVIIGGGTGGIMAASQLRIALPKEEIVIVEPSDTHYYQPAWTLVAAGTYSFERTSKPMLKMIPEGVKWIQDSVQNISPKNNQIITYMGERIAYDYLIVSPGLKNALHMVEGAEEALQTDHACSIYTDPVHSKNVIENFNGGVALFTQANTPIKCGGAPQKIMYLAEDIFRANQIADKSKIVFASPGSKIFGVKEIAETLMKVVDRKKINLRFGHVLKRIDSKNRIAWYTLNDNHSEYNHHTIDQRVDGDLVGIHYDMLHFGPPQMAPEFVTASGLANEQGWMKVNIHTLQHETYKNIFGIGDVVALPTAKTGAAIRKQVPVVIDHIKSMIKANGKSNAAYNGYSSCPLVTGIGKMVLAEFNYENKFTPDPKLKQMLVFDSHKEHWRLWILKKYILPYLYWNKMMKGKQV
ncbi:MAG TPA: FAD/NAD(P)-binding oxidoreductase [Bacteroidia bacterium]|nr:FAD/NAD(P)-binding oxidoreductase [Bacteroidia bacterium]HNT79639.1 FAD/NAD(P)-binding oxidoreductase [Bacteroidia bacterium]